MQEWDAGALAVLDRLTGAGYRAALVGGCVRDGLMGVTPHDFDIATSALPAQVEAVCAGLRVLQTGLKHGTVTVLSGSGPVEVTTFRREGGYSDHRHPDRVEFTAVLEEDLARRDFTMNAIAWERTGLTDPFGGQADLRRGLIRCVGDPDARIQEDALRILRGLRFSAQLDFALEQNTDAALRRGTPLLAHVSRERVREEWTRLICGPAAGRVLLAHGGAAGEILPELVPTMGFQQHNPHHSYDVYTHCVRAMERVPPVPRLRLAALLHDVGKPECFTMDDRGVGHFYGHAAAGAALSARCLRRLRLDNATRERVVTLILRHDLQLEPEERLVRRWLGRLGPELFFDLVLLARADAGSKVPDQAPGAERWDRVEQLARAILARGECLTLNALAADGRDAMACGLRGPAVGRALAALLDGVVDGRIPNQRAALLAELDRWAAEHRDGEHTP